MIYILIFEFRFRLQLSRDAQRRCLCFDCALMMQVAFVPPVQPKQFFQLFIGLLSVVYW